MVWKNLISGECVIFFMNHLLNFPMSFGRLISANFAAVLHNLAQTWSGSRKFVELVKNSTLPSPITIDCDTNGCAWSWFNIEPIIAP